MNSEIIYHYTSLEVLKCIFDNYSQENPFLTFWATNCAYMNDPREISEGIELIEAAIGPIAMPKPGGDQVILENDNIKETLISSWFLRRFFRLRIFSVISAGLRWYFSASLAVFAIPMLISIKHWTMSSSGSISRAS